MIKNEKNRKKRKLLVGQKSETTVITCILDNTTRKLKLVDDTFEIIKTFGKKNKIQLLKQ